MILITAIQIICLLGILISLFIPSEVTAQVKNFVYVQHNDSVWVKNTLGTDSARLYPPDSAAVSKVANQVYNVLGDSIQVFNSSGRVRGTVFKTWRDSVVLSGASPFTVDISSAGFKGIFCALVTTANNTSVVASMPLAEIKSYSNNQILINVLNSTSTLVNVLGSTVTGLSSATNLAGMKVFLRVDGY